MWRVTVLLGVFVAAFGLPTESVPVVSGLIQTPTVSSDMMNGELSAMPNALGKNDAIPPPPAAVVTSTKPEIPTISVDVGKDKHRTFQVYPSTNCKNRAHIMSSYIRKISKVECQAKCAFDSACLGYNIEISNTDEGECTILKGKCEHVGDAGHDLFFEQAQVKDLEKAPIPQPAAAAPQPEAKPALAQAQVPDVMLNLTIVIPSVRRFAKDGSPAPEKYLSPMVQKLWGDMSPEQQKSVKFLILNADKEPEKHVEALSLAAIPSVQILSKPNYDSQMEKALLKVGSIKENGEAFLEDGRQVNKDWIKWVASEDLDGAYLLEKGQAMSPYVLFLEDDIWPTSHALEKLTKFVQTMKHDDWLFIDLYTPNLDWGPGMLDVKNGEKYAFRCCTQSMLFRSDRLSGIIQYWRTHPGEPVDDNLREYREKLTPELYIYAARPNMFEHVGAYSSNPQKSNGVVEHQSIDFVPLLFQMDATTIPESVSV